MTTKIKGLSDKQKMAVDTYFTNGFNMTQALITAGWSPSTAKRQVSKFKNDPLIQAYMEEKRELIASDKIAKQEEILQALTTIVRREQKDQTVLQDGRVVQFKVSTADQLRAIEKMMKYYGMDKAEVNHNVSVQTVIYGESEEDRAKRNAVEGDYIEL